MLLAGTFSRVLDEKLRLPLPKPLRDALGSDTGTPLYIAPGTDGSLALYPENSFSRMADQLAASPPTGQDVRAFSRLFFSQAQRAELDGQGRVRIPTELVKFASLGKQVVLLGVRDHLELWDKAAWENYLSQHQPHYDQLAENAFSPSVVSNPPRQNNEIGQNKEGNTESNRPAQPR